MLVGPSRRRKRKIVILAELIFKEASFNSNDHNSLSLNSSIFRLLGLVLLFCYYYDPNLDRCPVLYLQRPESVKTDARDINDARFSVSLSDLPARVFQHEFDHLQVFFFS